MLIKSDIHIIDTVLTVIEIELKIVKQKKKEKQEFKESMKDKKHYYNLINY